MVAIFHFHWVNRRPASFVALNRTVLWVAQVVWITKSGMQVSTQSSMPWKRIRSSIPIPRPSPAPNPQNTHNRLAQQIPTTNCRFVASLPKYRPERLVVEICNTLTTLATFTQHVVEVGKNSTLATCCGNTTCCQSTWSDLLWLISKLYHIFIIN